MKIFVVAAARPNFMKVAPVMEAFRKADRADVEVLLVHTGQHYSAAMSDSFFRDLNIPDPQIHLGVGSGSHAEQTARVMVAFEAACIEHKPDWAVVVGDVNSTMACAITAKKLGVRVAHIEAGLRSGDMAMPEEINRLCTDVISDLLFTTDTLANDNLQREGVPPEKIRFVGNTMIDTLLRHVDTAKGLPLPEGLSNGQYAVLTLHRPSNVDDRDQLAAILRTVAAISRRIPIVFPAHPRTTKNMREFGLERDILADAAIRIIDPLSYLPFLGLVAQSRMVLTDSGGIQEETTVLGIPCLTLRNNTERPITCQIGTNILTGTDPEAIRSAADRVLDGVVRTPAIPELWDGQAATRIVAALLDGRQ